jgi:hypothetical protein
MTTHPAPRVSAPEAHHHLDWRHLLAHPGREAPCDDDLLARYQVEVALLVEQIGRLQHLGLAIELARQRLQEGADPASIDHLLAFALDSLGPDTSSPWCLTCWTRPRRLTSPRSPSCGVSRWVSCSASSVTSTRPSSSNPGAPSPTDQDKAGCRHRVATPLYPGFGSDAQ